MFKNLIFNILIANVVIIFLQNYVIAPLHVAAKYGHVHMVTLLVEKGSKIDIPNKVGTGLLQYYTHALVFSRDAIRTSYP